MCYLSNHQSRSNGISQHVMRSLTGMHGALPTWCAVNLRLAQSHPRPLPTGSLHSAFSCPQGLSSTEYRSCFSLNGRAWKLNASLRAWFPVLVLLLSPAFPFILTCIVFLFASIYSSLKYSSSPALTVFSHNSPAVPTLSPHHPLTTPPSVFI